MEDSEIVLVPLPNLDLWFEGHSHNARENEVSGLNAVGQENMKNDISHIKHDSTRIVEM